MSYTIEGVRVSCAPSGAVLYASDWAAVCRWALDRAYGFRYSGETTEAHKIVRDMSL